MPKPIHKESKEGRGNCFALVLPLVIAVLVVLQGGYYAAPTCIVALAFSAVYAMGVLVGKIPVRVSVATLLLAGIGVSCLVSALVNGPSFSMLLGSGFWFAVALMSLFLGAIDNGKAGEALSAFCWIGVAFSVLSLFIVCGALPVSGSLSDGRLHFLFQYANTAGAWFAAVCLLCGAHSSKSIRSLTFLPGLSLMLTQSMGALLLFLAALVASSVALLKSGRSSVALGQVASFACSLVLFALHILFGDAPMIAGALILAAFLLAKKGSLLSIGNFPAKAALAAVIAVSLALGALVLVVLPERADQAVQTLIERYIQIVDGLGVLAISPVFGIGPDMWGQVFSFYQTAQYYASSIHCGYLQIALDAGLLGLAFFVAFAVVGVAGLVRYGDASRLIAASLLLLHMLVDFDVEFSSMVLTLTFLLYAGVDRGVSAKRGVMAGAVGALVFLCALGVVCDAAVKKYSSECESAQICDKACSDAFFDFLCTNDIDVVTSWYVNLCAQGKFEEIVFLDRRLGTENGEQAFAVSAAGFALGNSASASDVLVSELERQPYNTELFEAAAELFACYGVDSSCAERYRASVARANELSEQGNAALLRNQKKVEECL